MSKLIWKKQWVKTHMEEALIQTHMGETRVQFHMGEATGPNTYGRSNRSILIWEMQKVQTHMGENQLRDDETLTMMSNLHR